MTVPPDWFEQMQEARHIDPHHVEFPAYCVSCHVRFSIWRSPDVCREIPYAAAQALHHELSPQCDSDSVRIAKPIPYGGRRRKPLEDYDLR